MEILNFIAMEVEKKTIYHLKTFTFSSKNGKSREKE